MSTYYAQDASNVIQMSSATPFSDATKALFPDYTFAETDEAIEYGYDGKLYLASQVPAPPAPTPDELRTTFDAAVTARLEAFATSSYSDTEQPFDSMDRARLASLTADYKQWGDIANAAYDSTWKAAEALVPQVMAGTLAIDAALEQLPDLAWEAAATATEPTTEA